MNILFITSSFEPGKDGVGDYARLLAQTALLSGHRCAVLALHDKFTHQSMSYVLDRLSVLRLPTTLDKKQKTTASKTFIERFQPDWISLQVVSYGYHKFGFVFELSSILDKVLPSNALLQINFHELWIGTEIGHQLKPFIIGQFQKYFLLRLIKKFDPVFVSATTEVFCFMLSQNKIASILLPSFSNIQKSSNCTDFKLLDPILANQERSNSIWFVFFGSINPNWNYRPLFSYLIDQQNNTGKKMTILSVGNLSKGLGIWEEIVADFSEQLIFVKLGERNDKEVSCLFQQCDFGLTGYPELVYEKSGAIAAMVDHGLKVIVSNDTVQQPGFERNITNPSILKLKDILNKDIRQFEGKVLLEESLLNKVSRQFLESFNRK
jgi:hypothetical protein